MSNYETIFSTTEFTCKSVLNQFKKVFSALEKAIEKAATFQDFCKIAKALWIVHHNANKLAGIDSISTSVIDNCLCQLRQKMNDAICRFCYAYNQQSYQKGLKEHNILNGRLLKYALIPVEAFSVLDFITDFIRIESFGDVSTVIQARNYIRIMYAFPEKNFAVWSKNIAIWEKAFNQEGKPDNCVYVHSSLRLNAPDSYVFEKYNFVDHVFTVFTKEYAKENNIVINCGGKKCMECIKEKINCYFRNTTKFINELKK